MTKKKIVFYTSTARNFRTTLLGYLQELQDADQYDVTLLSEKLDTDIEMLVANKKYFPAVTKIVTADQYSNSTRSLAGSFQAFYKQAHDILTHERPQLLITTSDIHSVLEMILCREARKRGCKVVTISATINPGPMVQVGKWVNLCNVNEKFQRVPIMLRPLILQARNWLGYVYVHCVLPLLNLKGPFSGKSSFIIYKGHTAMRASDLHIVFSQKEKQMYVDSGVNPNTIQVIPHPYTRNLLHLFREVVFPKHKTDWVDFLVLLPAEQIGFAKKSHVLISKYEKDEIKKQLLRIISTAFPQAKIAIKPHPIILGIDKIRSDYQQISSNIIFLPPEDPVDIYIEKARVVLELPRAVSTSLFTSSLQRPDIPVLSLDVHQEYLGDYYKGHKGIIYIDSVENFENWIGEYKSSNESVKQQELYERYDYPTLTACLTQKQIF